MGWWRDSSWEEGCPKGGVVECLGLKFYSLMTEESWVGSQCILNRGTNSSTLLNKLVDFVEQTRRLCSAKQYRLFSDAVLVVQRSSIGCSAKQYRYCCRHQNHECLINMYGSFMSVDDYSCSWRSQASKVERRRRRTHELSSVMSSSVDRGHR